MDTSSLIKLKIILVLFEILSCLRINYTKSHIFRIGTISITQIHNASSILQCQIGSLSFTYLGISLKPSKLARQDFLSIIDKVSATCHFGKEIASQGEID